ncbi:hypothetical protein Tco_0994707 [Tanacetum coccineum]
MSIEVKKRMNREWCDLIEKSLCWNVRRQEVQQVQCVRECKLSSEGINLGRFMWERFKLGDDVGDEEENNQKIDYEIIVLPLREKRVGQ